MTRQYASSRAAAAPAPDDRRASRAAAPPPQLRVVRPTPRRRRARLVTLVVSVAVMVSLFGVVASHVVLAQGQIRLDGLRSRAATEQDRYERLRLQVAELESPSRIVATAQERLGMVPPPSVTYLSPTGVVSSSAEKDIADDLGAASAVGEDDYARVKRSLASPR